MSKVFDSYAAYYDLLYRDKDYKLEVDYIVKLLKKYKVSSGDILELGSGTGKHAAHLAKFGFNIHGIDLSKSMVDIANSQNKLENTTYEVGDVRTYRINKLFDVVISLFHVASYQSSNADLEDMFLTAFTHLIPGGVLIFDFWYGPAVLKDLPTIRIKRLTNEKIKVTRIAEPVIYLDENTVNVNYDVFIEDINTKIIIEKKEVHKMRYFFDDELDSISKKVGFKFKHKYEWMSKKNPDLNSWNVVWVLKN